MLIRIFIIVALIASCAYRPDNSTPAPGDAVIFPHPSDIEEGTIHSKIAYSSDISYCMACHRSEKRSGRMRSCFVCHEDGFAHASGNFALPEVHGPVAIESGPMSVCVNCHGADLKGGIAPSCYQSGCHTGSVYPHNSLNYGSGSGHGSATSQSDFPDCLDCHEKSTAADKGIIACADCHHNSEQNCLGCHPVEDD